MPVTVRQAVVRVAAADPALPRLLRELLRFGVRTFLLLTPDAPDAAARAITAALPCAAEVSWLLLPPDMTPAAVIDQHRDRLHDRFVWCDGAGPFDGNLGDVIAAAARGVPLVWPGLAILDRHAAPPAAPVPPRTGLWPSRPALFLDRDGVINVDHGYVGSRDRFDWVAGAREAICLATRSGWHVFIVTNQSGVARGKYTEDDVRDLLDWLADEVRAAGGTIDDTRYCPFHEEATVPAYRRASDWRKPAPGMLLDLMRAWDLDPARCLMIGDQPTDMQAAARAGVEGHLFAGGNLLDFVRPLLARHAG